MSAVMMDPPTPLREVRPEVPEAFAALVSRCLEKDRDQRCGNVAEIAYGLAKLCPSRSRPLVDWIAMVLGVSAPSSPPMSMTAPMTAQATVLMSAAMGSGASRAFGGTTGATITPAEPVGVVSAGNAVGTGRLVALLTVMLVMVAVGLAGLREWHAQREAKAQPSSTGGEMPPSAVPAVAVVASSAPVSIARHYRRRRLRPSLRLTTPERRSHSRRW